jgi:serpin B
MKILLLTLILAAFAASRLQAADTDPATTAINSLGIDLLAMTGTSGGNALLSPYAIQEALSMTYAGADGKTRGEMAKVLHYPKDDTELNTAFASLQEELDAIHEQTEAAVKATLPNERRGPKEPVTLILANRLFAQSGFEFRKPFLDLLQDSYHAPLEQLDFATDPDKAKDQINGWVEEQTLKRIQNLVPDGALTKHTRLVLVNAIYLKAPWQKGFRENAITLGPFYVKGGPAENVPMMEGLEMKLGYAKRDGYTALSIPYSGSGLQFLVLLPDKVHGLAALEAKLTPKLLATCAKLDTDWVDLTMPKFKLEPPVMPLSVELKALGMKTAFDPSANFGRMATRGVQISEVFHKTFLSVDEHGTEAAAATAVSMVASDGDAAAFVHIDRPFLFAIQDCKSGACLFLGRVTDPR